MSIRNKLITGAALALVMTGPVSAQDTGADTVVATVNGTDITVGHMIVTKQGLPQQYRDLPDEVLFDAVLDQLVQQALLSQSVEGEPSTIARLTIENETRAILANQAVQAVVGEAVTDEALQAAYDAQYSDAEPEEEYNASHILVETEEEATDLIAQLDDGADFAELAKEHSTGPSGPGGGELGWFGAGVMVPSFEEAVTSLEVGAVSDPIQTQFGWHVVTLNDKRTKAAPALEDVRAELAAQIQQNAVADAVASLEESGEVTRAGAGEIDPSVLSDTGLIEN